MKLYTVEEIDELNAWFREQELPKEMRIDKSTYSPNLKKTVDTLLRQAYLCRENPHMQGCILLLKKIKANIEKND